MRFDIGARWTFVHSNGTRTATGKEAQVSTAWLLREPSQHSHWIYEGTPEVEEAAA